mmetsp:Transcript_22720/g.37574  ORF Transcript_22720/g.37574 Transcript_22720/m.37574 type:complete len:208 (-) Transcript_22720:450-1073(-)|eukprot:CAMPEP_0119311710 /NCGR_PEP_ID=MMETSP1333-20130426/23600_1 /TAXON_ID=418940 /ORGANISM="Scyphosphaera apsteinii, Strain RCC1455" /LENGTH=207 /DNA_ID=CAMNT_0007316173 /DNA_START=90 /DNA_END=713 /DNA_ORIENTATION=+
MSSNLQFGDAGDSDTQGLLGKAQNLAAGLKHPVTALFHVLFKALAVLVYIFGNWFSTSFVNIFVLCVLLLAFDFWTVKNVTGRLMVGLRWWSEVRDDGSTEWKFEAQEDGLQSTTLDVAIFWIGLFLPALIWILFGIGLIFRLSFDWLLLIATALALTIANIIGYVRCQKDARLRIFSGLQGVVTRTGMGNTAGRVLTSAAGTAFGM